MLKTSITVIALGSANLVYAQAISYDVSNVSGPLVTLPDYLQQITRVGSVTSQGDAAMNAPLARDPVNGFGVTGSGIKIGIISDSFNALGGMASGISSGDLPAGVTIVKDATGTDEGRAMAEIVHDVAPGAQILFHSAFNNASATPASDPSGFTIAKAIDNLVAAGANVIVDDVGLISQPTYQLDAAAVAIRNAKNAGVAYFTAAGNAGTESYEATFSNGGGGFHDFNPGATIDQKLDIQSVAPGQTALATLHWSDAYDSLGGTQESRFGIIFINPATSTQIGFQATSDNADDPVRFAVYTNNTGVSQAVSILVGQISGVAGETIKIAMNNSDVTFNDLLETNSASIYGHQLSEDGISVAAHRYDNLTSVESFSSRGPGVLLFDEDGDPIFDALDLPKLTGPQGANTSFFGGFDYESDGSPNFFGTSAAAPHVAAVAALMLERAADLGISLSVDDLYSILFSTAVDMGTPGFDNLSGYGRVDAFAAVSAVPEPTTLTLAGLGMVGLLQRRRRAA